MTQVIPGKSRVREIRTPGSVTRVADADFQVAELAARHRLPAIYATREFVEAGGLLSYAAHYPDLYQRAANYVDKIFKGASPADLPIEQPTKLEIVINLKTARALGLEIPPTLLAPRRRGDRVGTRRTACLRLRSSDNSKADVR